MDNIWFIAAIWIVRMGATRVSEPEIKFIFFILFFLGGLASSAKSEAVLPAYLIGLVVAGVFLRDKTLVHRMRSIAFAVFTPFYFIRAGSFVSLPALWTALGVIAVLLALKIITKFAGVLPLSRMFFMRAREANYTTLLMSTGLTFGTISALFGLQNKIIDQRQYSILVTVVILSAFVPTLIAQKFYEPSRRTMKAWGRLYKRKINGKPAAQLVPVKERRKEVAEMAHQYGITIGCETRHGHPAKTIVKFAADGGYDLVVIGHSDHSELWGRLLGDTADRISDRAHCSVLIVKQ